MQLVDKYKPTKLADFVGMNRARAVLSKFAADPYPSAWLFLGPSGLGKTTMSLALADELAAEVHHVASKSCDLDTVNDICHHCHYIPMLGKWHSVIVDEADQMSHAAQLAFLSKLDGTQSPPNTIFLFTANDTALLKDRFLSRCRTLIFSSDDLLAPLSQFLRNVYRREAPNQPEPDYRAIARQSGLNIRQALMNLELEIISPSPVPAAVPIAAKPAGAASYDQIRYRAIMQLKAEGRIDKSTPNNRVPRSVWAAAL